LIDSFIFYHTFRHIERDSELFAPKLRLAACTTGIHYCDCMIVDISFRAWWSMRDFVSTCSFGLLQNFNTISFRFSKLKAQIDMHSLSMCAVISFSFLLECHEAEKNTQDVATKKRYVRDYWTFFAQGPNIFDFHFSRCETSLYQLFGGPKWIIDKYSRTLFLKNVFITIKFVFQIHRVHHNEVLLYFKLRPDFIMLLNFNKIRRKSETIFNQYNAVA
jgi:hypothetical protein